MTLNDGAGDVHWAASGRSDSTDREERACLSPTRCCSVATASCAASGSGGTGTVYEAIDERFRSRVALKESVVTSDPRLVKAFEREARLLRTLRHPALPGVIDYFKEGPSWFLVMDFVPGDDFEALAERRGGPFPVPAVLSWGDQLLEALEFLHGHVPPIVHRDVKPPNMKLTPEGRIVLLDFGLSKGFLSSGSLLGASTASGAKSLFGYTPHYAPIEQIRGVGTDPRSDLYAAAATLWTLMTGAVPPDALQRASTIDAGEPDPLRPAYELNPRVPVAVSNVLHAALAQDPQRRPDTAATMRRLLREAPAKEVPTQGTVPDGVAPTLAPLAMTIRGFPAPEVQRESAPPLPPLPLRSRTTYAVFVGVAAALAGAAVIVPILAIAVPLVADSARSLRARDLCLARARSTSSRARQARQARRTSRRSGTRACA